MKEWCLKVDQLALGQSPPTNLKLGPAEPAPDNQ
jgi:hypothetical protein